MKPKPVKILFTLLLLSLISACGQFEDGQIKPPLVYRIDIQQGNVITQSMLNKLKPGMDERQVKFIMGTPLLEDPFHPDRWEYLYYEQESGEEPEGRRITLYFEEGLLTHLSGNVKVTYLPVKDDESRNEKSVVVPDEYGHRGLFDKLLDRRPEINKKKKDKKKKERDFDGALKTKKVAEPEAEPETEEIIEDTAELDNNIINAVDQDLDISETQKQDLEQAEAPEEKPGFFSRMWDEMTGNDQKPE